MSLIMVLRCIGLLNSTFSLGKESRKCILLTIATSKSVSFSDKLSVNFLSFDKVYDESKSNFSPYHHSAFPVQSHLLWVVIKILRKCLPNKSKITQLQYCICSLSRENRILSPLGFVDFLFIWPGVHSFVYLGRFAQYKSMWQTTNWQ